MVYFIGNDSNGAILSTIHPPSTLLFVAIPRAALQHGQRAILLITRFKHLSQLPRGLPFSSDSIWRHPAYSRQYSELHH